MDVSTCDAKNILIRTRARRGGQEREQGGRARGIFPKRNASLFAEMLLYAAMLITS